MMPDSIHAKGRPVAQATGRLRRVSLLALAIAFAAAAGCQPGEAPPPAPAGVLLEGPSLAGGAPDDDAARARETAELLEEGERALQRGLYDSALGAAAEIEERLARVPGSARALFLRARAHRGLEQWEAADRAIFAFLDRISSDDPLLAEATLVQAAVRMEGSLSGDVEALFQIPSGAPEGILDEAEGLADRSARGLELAALRDLVNEAPQHPRILPVFLTELALRRAFLDDQAAAEALATRALALEPGSATAERARGVLEGRLGDLDRAAVVVGGLLSAGGPPSLSQLSAQIREGIEVALARAGEQGLPVRFEATDDGGAEARASELVAQLESAGAAGLIGPLMDGALARAAAARRGALPIVSPTARVVPEGVSGVLSLTGVDPAASRTLAQLALDDGVRDVVVLHPSTTEMTQEAQHFREAFQERGGRVTSVVTYLSGTTDFAGPFGQVVRLRPAGLVLLLPVDDVPLVAPQVAYFGVDDMEIRILGNEAWTSDAVLSEVNPRHTDGVLSVSSRSEPGVYGPGWNAFVEAYEAHFQRTLRSPIPALGYDAARLLLQAVREGGGTPEGTAQALASVRGFQGATGVLNVVDGRIQRSYLPVRIENRQPIPYRP